MGNRRGAQVPTSDEEDDGPLPRNSTAAAEYRRQRKRKMVQFSDEDEEKEIEEATNANKKKKKKKKVEEPEPESDPQEGDEQVDVEAHPLGEVIRVSAKGRGKKKNHYASFEYDGQQYQLEDSVLLVPEDSGLKPYVAIIKDISQVKGGAVMITGQWFYRPEEAEKKGGGNWKSHDTREVFYSFHRDEVPAESVMHKCVVHFIPKNKQIPNRKQHPGFIVQKVYDTEQRRLFKLTDKDYEEGKQHEIDLLVEKTLARLGDLPDLEPDAAAAAAVDHEDDTRNKRLLKKRSISHLDVSRDDEGFDKPQSQKVETPLGVSSGASEYQNILLKFKLLTGETQRDKWLEKLLQSIEGICTPKQNEEEEKGTAKHGGSDHQNVPRDKNTDHGAPFDWPDAAVPAIAALEKAAHETLSADYQKYNQKMRSLSFNLKSNGLLSRRLMSKELEPAQILNMMPNELKSGYTAEELASREPEKPGRMQMTDARCKRCNEKQVALLDIIQAGHGDRYQLECVACGNTWYASRDDAASLTIEGTKSSMPVGSAPLATAKFEDVQKNLATPREAEKGPIDAIKKKTEAFLPVLENQKSLNKIRAEENPGASKTK